jgi:hypothetical protein
MTDFELDILNANAQRFKMLHIIVPPSSVIF